MTPTPAGRLHRGLPWLVAAHFAAGMADHALLIVVLSMLLGQGEGFWWAPLLKIGFTCAYVLLAPWSGRWVDQGSKSSWMRATHAAKALAVAALLVGAWPLVCFALVGVAAALYAPARYGWVTEVTPAPLLVRANAWLEVGLVGAGLMGTVLGGALVSPGWRQWIDDAAPGLAGLTPGQGVPASISAALLVLAGFYCAAWMLNRAVPASGWVPTQPPNPAQPPLRDFRTAQRALWSDLLGGRLSLAATTLFWGVGAVLQLIVLQWATERLDLALHQAAYLQALIAVGMVAGAVWAGRHVKLEQAARGLRVGLALGILVPLASMTTHFGVAAVCLALAGAAAGYTVIPLNALLQHRGIQLLTPGRSIAVQVFNENASILALLSAYALLSRLQVAPVTVMWMLGLGVAATMGVLMRWARRHPF